MKFNTEDFVKPCGCRSVGECDHNSFAWADALDSLVDAFATEMKKKMRKKFTAGQTGWDNPAWKADDIRTQLSEHVTRGDPVDVANFAAFWWNKL